MAEELTAELIHGFTQAFLWKEFDSPVDTPEFHHELWELACDPHKYVAIAAPRG